MSAGRGTQGQLNTDISAAVGQSTWTERSPSTERQLTCYLQYADMRLPDQYKDTIQSSVVYSRVSSRIEWWRLLVSLSFYMGANLQLLCVLYACTCTLVWHESTLVALYDLG